MTFLQGYCWIHGSTYIPKQYQPHLKCIVDQEGMETEVKGSRT